MVPAVISMVAAGLASWAQSSGRDQRIASGCLVLGWGFAVGVALWGRQEIDGWPSEAWQQVLVPITFGSLVLAFSQSRCFSRDRDHADPTRSLSTQGRDPSLADASLADASLADASLADEASVENDVRLGWLAGLSSVLTAWSTMPRGDAWSDTFAIQPAWLAVVALAGIVNLWGLARMRRDGAERWLLWVSLAGLAAPTILAASAYGGLAEWLLASIVATFIFAVVSFRWLDACSTVLVFPATLLAVSATATGRFYTYEDHSVWVYGAMLSLPLVVSLADAVVRRRASWLRVFTSATVAGLLLGIIAWAILGAEPAEAW